VSFLLECPQCGPREVTEFRYGGEAQARPAPGSAIADWSAYLYGRDNVAGVERAWWFHRDACRRWFQADRDTNTNDVIRVGWQIDG
jgi:heterotetrameric sarcosine oxidase delta subunit